MKKNLPEALLEHAGMRVLPNSAPLRKKAKAFCDAVTNDLLLPAGAMELLDSKSRTSQSAKQTSMRLCESRQ